MERYKQIQGLIAGTRRYGELNKSVNVLSPEEGLFQAVIYGGRKGKNCSVAPLFSYGTFQIYNNPVKNEYSIKESDCTFTADRIMKDIKLTAAASYMCEVSCRIKTDSPEDVYNLLKNAITILENGSYVPEKIIIDFTWKLLQFSGTAGDFSACPSCDRVITDNEVLHFSTTMTTPVCQDCADTDRIVLTPGARKYLNYTFPMTFEQALEVKLFETAQKRIMAFLLNWVSAFCRWPLNSLKSGLLI